MSNDHYAILGVSSDADYPTIRAAYLQQMRTVHPDRCPGDPAAAEAARRLNAAFRVLKDQGTRADYDRARTATLPRSGEMPANYLSTRGTRPTGRHDLSAEEKAKVPGAQNAQAHYRAFHLWCLRVSLGLVSAGLLLLLAIGG